ncbi:membrane protein [Streptomyces griseoflavus]|uniref:YhgE/Pip domain-containing protein n=1 Tax=Streptomyces rimosus TaxID=1927 RepID=UPI0004C81E32|nr:YhgE/Pip domain-containing protein [Streptomyces rimosus]KOG52964.1 membrane protein [Streptomyces griseoflavus]
MRSPKLAALELKRFGRGKLPRLGLVALMLIPLLYGALYLCSFWDPYANLDKIPVALVNDDKGATAGGKKIQAGDELVKNVKDSNTFNWEEVSASDAAKGVENGTYYLSLTVPKDFSERIASSSGDHPETGALQVRTNDANNYIVGSISKTIFSEIRAKTSAKSSREFFDKIFVSFSDLHDQTAKAADGANKLDDGLGKAKDGTDKLADGLGTAKDKNGELTDGLGKLNDGSGKVSKGAGDVHKGLGTLNKGATEASAKARQLSEGAGKVAAGTQQLADQVNGLAKKDLPFLKKHGKEIADKARKVADLTQALDEDLGKLPGNSAKALQQARQNAADAEALYKKSCGATPADGVDCAKLKGIAAGTAAAVDLAEKVDGVIAKTDFQQLRTKLRDLHQGAEMVADQVPGIVNNADASLSKINQLNQGAHQVSQGAGQFATGINALASGSGKLTDGAGKVANGAGQLHDKLGDAKDGSGKIGDGLGQLEDGALDLKGGVYKLKDGSNQLAGGLNSGVDKIPDYDKKDRDARTEVMSNPVELASKSMHKAPNYGTGLAPYFIPLSLWVGAMVAYMLLAPLGKRALAAGAPGWRIALGSWLPAFAIGVVQVLALMAVLHWGLGLEMERAGATIGFLLLSTAAFTAIIQFFGAQFGPAGRVLTLVVLMLQLTSAGGTYPVQTSPGFFGAIHPFLPMSYVVDGLRRLITGGDLGIVWQGSIVLAAFTVGALALTSLTARSRQVVRMKDLHPELSL